MTCETARVVRVTTPRGGGGAGGDKAADGGVRERGGARRILRVHPLAREQKKEAREKKDATEASPSSARRSERERERESWLLQTADGSLYHTDLSEDKYRSSSGAAGTHFTFFTSTKVQILTPAGALDVEYQARQQLSRPLSY